MGFYHMADTTNLKQLLSGVQLPALPQSAIRLLELSQDPNNGPTEFAVPIEADPGLTGQVLRFVNSSYFGFSREIASVKLAITLVGIRTIKNFALWSAVFSLMPNPRCGPFDLKSLWQDSLRRAIFSRAMGNILGMKDAEELFAAALLQDMAVPLLAKELPDAYVQLLEERSDGQVRLSTLEREKFGWDHAQAAAVLARSWSLPEQFAVLIESHNQIDTWADKSGSDPGKFSVSLSALLPSSADKLWHDRVQLEELYNRVAGNKPSLPELLEEVDKNFEEFAPVLKLATPAKSLVESYHEAVEAVGV
jgi:HD-like signal output (HDOD) protein